MYVSKNGVTVRVNPFANLLAAILLIMFGLVFISHPLDSPFFFLIGAGMLWLGWRCIRQALHMSDRARAAYMSAAAPRRRRP